MNRIRLFSFLVLLALGAGGIALAQTGADTADRTTVDADDDRDMDMGWIGLIGLAGLLGLRRREHHHTTTTGSNYGSTPR